MTVSQYRTCWNLALVDLSVGLLELEAADQERQRMTTGATIDANAHAGI